MGLLFAWLAASSFSIPLSAQTLDGLSAKGGKIPKFDRQNRLESLLSVQEAQRSNEFSHLKGLVWMGFVYSNSTRLTNLVIRSPECSIHNASQSIYSDKAVKLDIGSDDISLEGIGFLLAQTNTSIFVSNEVRSVIKVPGRLQTTNTHAQPSDLSAPQASRYWVDSKEFEFLSKTRTALYQHSVVLTDKLGFTLHTERLSAVLMTETNRLEAIYANTNLLVELVSNNQTNRIEGEQGVYTFGANPRNDVIEITQHPTWALPSATGSADKLRLQPRLNRFEAFGNGFARLNDPKEALEKTPGNSTKDARPQQTPSPIEIRFGEGAFEPGLIQVTNSVSANQGERLKLECFGLRGFLEPTNNALQKLEGNGNVRLKLSERNQTVSAKGQHLELWLKGENASQLQITDAAEWSTKLYSGKGEVIWIDMARKIFQASNNASARIVFQTSTNLHPPAKTKPGTAQRFGFGADQVDIVSDRYGVRPGNADFEGAVKVVNPEWRMECSRLHFQLNPEDNQIENVEAFGNVIFEHFEPKTPATPKNQAPTAPKKPNYFSSIATNSSAPWKLSCQQLGLKVASPANHITMIQASEKVTLVQGTSFASGDLLVYDAEKETLKLTGMPTVKTESQGEMRGVKNSVLIFDLKEDKFTHEGAVDMILRGGAFSQPEVKPRRIP